MVVTTRRSVLEPLIVLVLIAAAGALWIVHARAWDLGGRSPVLSFDTAQYAVAARELATHGRLATPFALPLELDHHPQPPWPLAVVQPGLVLVEAALFRWVPPEVRWLGAPVARFARPDEIEWLVLPLPLLCYIALAALLAVFTFRVLARRTTLRGPARAAAALAVAGAYLLDPEAQHLSVGGFTEPPFTLGMAVAIASIATGFAVRRPLLFGLLLGLAGAFRGTMLWLAPLLAVAAAHAATERRGRVIAWSLIGYALPLLPWWLYKWHTFGSPAWDLSALAVWDGVQGRTWFTLTHLPEAPLVPHGAAAAVLLAAKVVRQLPGLVLALFGGARAVLVGALALWCVVVWRDPGERPLRAAALGILACLAALLLTAAIGVPWYRYVHPARVLAQAAGLLALWSLIARIPDSSPAFRRALAIALAAIVLVSAAFESRAGLAEVRRGLEARGTPSVLTLLQITVLLNREIPAGEPVMSNLGPELAWEVRRPVVHLALTPADVDACRRHLDLHHVLLVFRDPAHAWAGWNEVVARPQQAVRNPEWNFRRVRAWRSPDGFSFVWLECGPLQPRFARAGDARYRSTATRRTNVVASSTWTRAR